MSKPQAQTKTPETDDIPIGTDVTTAVQTGLVVPDQLLGMMEGDQKYTQIFDPDQMIIPRLLLLQDLSPQVKENKAEYIVGARPGMFCLPLVKGLTREVMFIPSRFDVRYLAWRPRKEGGGLVASDLTLEDAETNFTQDGPGSWIGTMAPRPGEQPVNVEVKETPEWIGLARSDVWDWMPCVMSFPATKAKVARAINTTISLVKLDGKNGKFTPPSFYHQFKFTSAFEERDAGDFWTPVADRVGWASDAEALADARQLAISAAKGIVVADDGAGA
jgi:hypothetical protein